MADNDKKPAAEVEPAETPKPVFPSNRHIKEGSEPPRPEFTRPGELKRLIMEDRRNGKS